MGFGSINYRILSRPDNQKGLELAIGLGFRGYQEYLNKDNSIAYGIDLKGKYVLDEGLAMSFAVDMVKWKEEHRKDKNEYRYSVGIQKSLAKDWTASAHYTYRDLRDFVQDDAHEARLAVNHNVSKNIDIGVSASYSSFDANKNGYKLEDNFDGAVAIYGSYRF